MKLLATSIQTLEKYDNQLDKLVEVAVEHGLNPNNLNIPNLTTFVATNFKELRQFKEVAISAGYKSLGVALKSLRQYKGVDDNIPSDMMYAPQHWIHSAYTEDVDDRTYKVGAVDAVAAQGRRKKIHSMLDDFFYAVKEAPWSPLDKKGMIETCRYSYFNGSFEDFSRYLLSLLIEISDRENEDWSPGFTEESVAGIWKQKEIEREREREKKELRAQEILRESLEKDPMLNIDKAIEFGILDRAEMEINEPEMQIPIEDPWAETGDDPVTNDFEDPWANSE